MESQGGAGRSELWLSSLLLPVGHQDRGLCEDLGGTLGYGLASAPLVDSMSNQARMGPKERCLPWEKGPARTGQEELPEMKYPDLTYTAGLRVLGKEVESPPRLNYGNMLSFNYPRNPEEGALPPPLHRCKN